MAGFGESYGIQDTQTGELMGRITLVCAEAEVHSDEW